jgi:DNA-binding response OmpR family regulator
MQSKVLQTEITSLQFRLHQQEELFDEAMRNEELREAKKIYLQIKNLRTKLTEISEPQEVLK